jgi:hypothetical protein
VFSEQKATFALYNSNSLVFITEVESVYSAVRTKSLYMLYVPARQVCFTYVLYGHIPMYYFSLVLL